MKLVIAFALFALCASVNSETIQPLPESVPSTATVMQSMSTMPLAFTQNNGQWPDSILYRASANGATMWFTKSGVYYQFVRQLPDEAASFIGPRAETSELRLPRLPAPPQRAGVEGRSLEVTPRNDSVDVLSQVGQSAVADRCGGADRDPDVLDPLHSGTPLLAVGSSSSVIPAQAGIHLLPDTQSAAPARCGGADRDPDVLNPPARHCEERSDAAISYSSDRAVERICPTGNESVKSELLLISSSFQAANPYTEIIADGAMDYKCNYFLGNDSTKWRTDVPNFTSITYKEIYPGIDLKYYGNGRQMEYDFIVSPFADINQIRIQYSGIEDICINQGGQLQVETKWNTVTENTPYVYQLINGIKTPLTGEYYLVDNNSFGFKLSEEYNPALAVVIDPVLSYSTYLGVSLSDRPRGMVIDATGAMYLTGNTSSSNFPTVNAYQAIYAGNSDVFVTKLSSNGSSLVFSTFLGGTGADISQEIAVDLVGSVYITGSTGSTTYPTANAFQPIKSGSDDVFATKLSSSGSTLVYSTYLGGSSSDVGKSIAVDTSGAAYITGYTASTNYPIFNAFQAVYASGGFDAFVTKLSSSGSGLVFSTFLGGNNDDRGNAITVSSQGAAHVTGNTFSNNFPTASAYQAFNSASSDAFIAKFSINGTSLQFSTYLGGSSTDVASSVFLDPSGAVYLTGSTESPDFPTQNPYQAALSGITDAFVSKLSASGQTLLYSTYLGGTGSDNGTSIVTGAHESAYITGITNSLNFPTVNATQAVYGGAADAFISKLSAFGASLVFSTYLGGSGSEEGPSIAIDSIGALYVAGQTNSTNFPTISPFQASNGGNYDAFMTKYSAPDIDGDGIPDEIDNCPNVANPGQEDADFDGIGNVCDADFGIVNTTDSADIFFVEQADLDEDNNSDIIFSGNTNDGIFVAWGKPDGTLESPVSIGSGIKAAITVDFLDNDTLLDVATRTSTTTTVLLNQGARNFAPALAPSPSFRSESSTLYSSVTSGYFNNDIFPDLIVSENMLLLGNGTGQFGAPVSLPFLIDGVDAGDFNNDFIDDIVVTRGDSARIYLNNGSGVFTASSAVKITQGATNITQVKTQVDLNHDGKLDYVTIAGHSLGLNDTSVVTAVMGNGSGGVQSSTILKIVGTALNVAVSDINNDRVLDISVVISNTRTLKVHYGNGFGGFNQSFSETLPAGAQPIYALASLDLDRDGRSDFVIGGESGNSIILAVNQLEDAVILPDEMVTTGYDNIGVSVENPQRLTISKELRTVAGSAYWKLDADADGSLDTRAFDYNFQAGNYQITVYRTAPISVVPVTAIGIGIDGSQEARVVNNYSGLPAGDSMTITYTIPNSVTSPASGMPSTTLQPVISWDGFYARGMAITYDFQMSAYHDFRSLMLDTANLPNANIGLPDTLPADSLYYWRVRQYGQAEFSHACALWVVDGACGRLYSGNVDCDTADVADISDLTALIDHLFISLAPLCCISEANIDGEAPVDISDLTRLIDHLFISLQPNEVCQ